MLCFLNYYFPICLFLLIIWWFNVKQTYHLFLWGYIWKFLLLFPQHRKELVDAIHRGLSLLKSDKTASNSQSRMPSYGTQVQKELYNFVINFSTSSDISTSFFRLPSKQNLRSKLINSGARKKSEIDVEQNMGLRVMWQLQVFHLYFKQVRGKTHLTILLGLDQDPIHCRWLLFRKVLSGNITRGMRKSLFPQHQPQKWNLEKSW